MRTRSGAYCSCGPWCGVRLGRVVALLARDATR
uniref:Uncharacterized protein n=1 Tax=Anguilla anguilla TaxID=7936 RepID=A0A0E9PJY0_ANGAN